MAAQALNATRDTFEPIDARGGGNVNVNRFTLPKDAREIIISIVMAVSVITSLVLWSKLHDAEKDIQTQIWLRNDSLSKENAELRGHIIAAEDLMQAYGIGKTVQQSKQEKGK